MADLNPSYGCEQKGLRPVLVIQNDVGNRYSPTVIVAAITSSLTKPKLPTHVFLLDELDKPSIVLLEQVRTLDKKRLRYMIGSCGVCKMKEIDRALLISMGCINIPFKDI